MVEGKLLKQWEKLTCNSLLSEVPSKFFICQGLKGFFLGGPKCGEYEYKFSFIWYMCIMWYIVKFSLISSAGITSYKGDFIIFDDFVKLH